MKSLKKNVQNFSIPLLLVAVILIFGFNSNIAGNIESYISTEKSKDSFTLSADGLSVPLLVNSDDYPGVIRILKLLQRDIAKVTSAEPGLSLDIIPNSKQIIIVGTIGKSKLIDKMIEDGKLDVDNLKEKWETFSIQTVKNPLPDVETALVIAGSDKRGTIYGMFDLSEEIGVSPWYWWADVPVKKKSNIYVLPGNHSKGEPKVKYRGIFINDEAPALSGWSIDKFGTEQFNHKLYEHVFELILRLKGNFLWPAMWGRAFYDDDELNPKLADEYGIVISTSHHEPMMRAHVEWNRYGSGPWNYGQNKDKLKEFWKEGIERMGSYESIVTLAMRGDGDEAMSSTANVELLQKVVEDQRKILGEVTGKDVTTIPQVWALYKEVQEYYDKGMRVPDDVTLLLCDDNWGNVRKLPKLSDKPRKGGYGIYYHYDFVGGPRNYKWLNTTQIERVWEQMHLSYEYGADEIWIVNVGDLKPMEFPIEFFLDYAWNPEEIKAEDLPDYYNNWVIEQFGSEFTEDISDILKKYTKYNSRRKPEMLSPETYSLINYREAERVVEDYNVLYNRAKNIYDSLSDEYKDSFYQLVLHPVEACSNLNELYVTVGKNRLYAKQGRNLTNSLADKAEELFKKDAEITKYYNEELAGGKWNHFMDQTHIGYTYWQQPDSNSMPEIERVEFPKNSEMGIAIEGSSDTWSDRDNSAVLPIFDPFNNQSYYIEIFNKGISQFNYSIETGKPWIKVSSQSGIIETENKVYVSIDWDIAPAGMHEVPLKIRSDNNTEMIVNLVVNNNLPSKNELTKCYIGNNGTISIEAVNYTNLVESPQVSWKKIPNLGRTGSSITQMPVTAQGVIPNKEGSRLEYDVYLFNEGEVNVDVYISPLINFGYSDGIRFAVSFDDEAPQIININENDTVQDWKYPQYWNQMVSNNIRVINSNHTVAKKGKHTLKIWGIDPGIVFQIIVIDADEIKQSYLGPPESLFVE